MLHLLSVFVWTGENDSKKLRVDEYFFFFLEKGEKESPLLKISGYVLTGLSCLF